MTLPKIKLYHCNRQTLRYSILSLSSSKGVLFVLSCYFCSSLQVFSVPPSVFSHQVVICQFSQHKPAGLLGFMVNILNFKSHEQGASAEESSGSPSLMWIDTSQHLQVAAQLKTDWQKVRFSSLAHLGFPSVSKLISPVQAVVDYLSDIRTSVSRVHR